MRKNYFATIVKCLSLVSLCTLMSCTGEMPDAGNSESEPDGGRKLSIENARTFFDGQAGSFRIGPAPGPDTRSPDDPDDQGEEMPQPSWDGAVYTTLLGDEVIEVPFHDLRFTVSSPEQPQSGETSDSDGDETAAHPGNTLVRLIAGLDKEGGIYYMLIYATPTEELLAAKGLSIDTFTLADIDTTYSGSLRYYDIEGELLGGYICVDGIIVYHISPADGYNGDNGTEDGGSGDEDSDPVAGLLYFAGQNCVPVAVPYGMYWYFFYLDSDGSWVLKEIRISRIWTEWEVECSSTEEGEIIHNFVNTAGGGGGNDSDDDDDEEDDEEISVDLMISPLYCDIGDRFTISVSISPQDADVDVAEIYIAGFGIGWKGLTTLSKNEIYHGFALQPGNFSYKATIYAGNKSYDSQEMTAVYGFPGRSKVLARQEVQTGMAQSWASTLSAANAYNTQEFGGIVMIDTRGSAPQYRYIHHQGPKVGYPESAHIKMDYDDSFSRDPRYGGQFAVMGFHTHPPLFNYTGTDILRRLVGPSDGDNIDALPQVVQDFVGINGIHTNRDPKNSPTQLYYYSVDKRTQLPY